MKRIVAEGIEAGALGATAVATWFLLYDVVQGRPCFTPALLGAVLFHGLRDVAAVSISWPLVLGYSLLHWAAFALFGIAAAALLAEADRQPALLFVFVMLVCCFEVFALALRIERLRDQPPNLRQGLGGPPALFRFLEELGLPQGERGLVREGLEQRHLRGREVASGSVADRQRPDGLAVDPERDGQPRDDPRVDQQAAHPVGQLNEIILQHVGSLQGGPDTDGRARDAHAGGHDVCVEFPGGRRMMSNDGPKRAVRAE